MNHKLARLGALLLGLCAATAAWSETFEVKMLNRGSQGAMVYEPEFIRLQPGDKLKFLASSNGHDAVSIDGMLPAGARPFKGRINEEIEVTFTEAGLYGIKCLPHYAMGMVMLVQVGDAPLSALQIPAEAPERAQKRFQHIAARAAR
ncbi:pseudoazurin [Comamonas endophytica]|uniref:Pseudoazurin n=2 Tax=Comamonas endophytica TaxID=2949090 RepID=A0ABY6GF64_9BURK|nr:MULTISPECIES: pseudoazurin [unclassified Acidovorax]MCD2514446.1 pseudoazurin [Acidovorax sp. D4N7]UYG53735.1 pseudoazurin [Acidovorax sp. 5MLIR]